MMRIEVDSSEKFWCENERSADAEIAGVAGFVGVIGVEHDVPSIETIATPVGDDVAGLEGIILGAIGQPFAQPEAVNTTNRLGWLHAVDVTVRSRSAVESFFYAAEVNPDRVNHAGHADR